MTKIAAAILDGLQDTLVMSKGGKAGVSITMEEIDIAALRKRLKMTQKEFSGAYNIDLRTLQAWEQGQRKPRGPAKTLLRNIAADQSQSMPKLNIDNLIKTLEVRGFVVAKRLNDHTIELTTSGRIFTSSTSAGAAAKKTVKKAVGSKKVVSAKRVTKSKYPRSKRAQA